MAFNKEQLDRIYCRTTGYCHICGDKLARTNYAKPGKKGAWEVEHSVPRSKAGTDHPNNLFPACIDCNRNKSDRTTRAARAWHGKTRAPLSAEKRKQAKVENGILGAAGGAAIGLVVAGPAGALVGALAGGALAGSKNPDR
jgi:hypothetical protein